MPNQTDIQNAILNGSYALGVLTDNNYNLINKGQLSVRENFIQFFRLNLQALQDQYNLGDYTSSTTVTIYDRVNGFIGVPFNVTVDPNFQTPGVVYNITQGKSVATYTRIPFSAQTTVQLLNFQSVYVPTYGDFAIVTIWTTQDGGATYQQDTSTVPTIVNLGGNISLPNSYTWTYPIPTTGYVQINGFITI